MRDDSWKYKIGTEPMPTTFSWVRPLISRLRGKPVRPESVREIAERNRPEGCECVYTFVDGRGPYVSCAGCPVHDPPLPVRTNPQHSDFDIVKHCLERSMDGESDFYGESEALAALERVRVSWEVLAEYAGIGIDRPPEEVFQYFRRLHTLDSSSDVVV